MVSYLAWKRNQLISCCYRTGWAVELTAWMHLHSALLHAAQSSQLQTRKLHVRLKASSAWVAAEHCLVSSKKDASLMEQANASFCTKAEHPLKPYSCCDKGQFGACQAATKQLGLVF